MNQDSQNPSLDFSVVIPALDLRASLELILRCLEAQTYPADRFECIIVDDGSADGTRRFLESHQPTSFRLTFISHAVPQGRGAARNQGWRRAQGKVVVFLDGDTLPAPQWLSDYERAFASGVYDVVSGGRYCIEVNPKRGDLFQCLAGLAQTTVEDLFRNDTKRQFDCLHNLATLSVYRVPAFQKFELEVRQICLRKPGSLLCA
jgi:glycosyltransferase involved in cell wall biosynthesis